MSSVTTRIKEIKQPDGGYLKISDFDITVLNDDNVLNENENIHALVIGLVVDYMTRFMAGTEIDKAFEISIWGLWWLKNMGVKIRLKNLAYI